MEMEILAENMRLRNALSFLSGYMGQTDEKMERLSKVCDLVLEGKEVFDAVFEVDRNQKLN
jgi:hypothetical protein